MKQYHKINTIYKRDGEVTKGEDMREIKFRAWDKENNIMVMDVGITPEGTPYLSPIDADGPEDMFYYEDSELMQFIGLKDKNGKEVYEGDIVKWGANDAIEIGFGWGDDAEAYGESFGVLIGSSVFCGAHKDCEVVGNIYENPELLK